MKKLILVTLTAFAASWLLAEVRRGDSPRPPRPLLAETRHNVRPALNLPPALDRPEEPDSIRSVPWKKKRTPGGHVSLAAPASPKTPPPSWFPLTERDEDPTIDASGSRVVVGRVSASEDRARQDLRQAVERAVGDWIAADVPTTWKVPSRVLDQMVQASYTQQVTRNLIEPGLGESSAEKPGLDGLFTLYRAGQKLDFSPQRKARIIGMYRQELASRRMQRLGGGLVLALATLAVLSGYIKADEATRGYYTNRLRFLSAAGLGVAGAVAYRLWA